MGAIHDLLESRPHMREKAHYDLRELRAYHEGYYQALIMAIRCIDLAQEADTLARTTRRAQRQRQRSA